jgi:hypothetical protein
VYGDEHKGYRHEQAAQLDEGGKELVRLLAQAEHNDRVLLVRSMVMAGLRQLVLQLEQPGLRRVQLLT